MAPGCSVIVCTRSRSAELQRCLASLAAQDHDDFEVVVVDNSEGDAATQGVVEQAGAAYVLEPRGGLSAARNSGVQAAEGELLAFIDDDAIADPSWLGAHRRALEDSAAIASTGRILPLPSTAAAPELAPMLDLGERGFVVDRQSDDWFERANFGGLGFGGNMVFRRRAFGSGLRFCERLGRGAPLSGGEESYAFFSLIRDGSSVEYVPSAVVRHDPPAAATRRSRELDGARRYAAYLCMLLAEEPEFRARTIRYIADALRRPQQPWRRIDAAAHTVSRPRTALAAAGGPLLYLRSRRAKR